MPSALSRARRALRTISSTSEYRLFFHNFRFLPTALTLKSYKSVSCLHINRYLPTYLGNQQVPISPVTSSFSPFIHLPAITIFSISTATKTSSNLRQPFSRMITDSARSTLTSDSVVEAHKLTVDDLSQQHRDIFTRALFNVLFTPAAETTFAQIIDGAPLSQSVVDTRSGIYPPTHPIHDQHLKLCPGVLDRARQSRSTFDLNDLKFNARVRNWKLSPCRPAPTFSSLVS